MRVSNGEYPLYEGDIRLEHHNIDESLTGDNFPCPDTFVKVEQLERPLYDFATQYVKFAAPVLQNGKWVSGWTICNLSQEAIARRKRNKPNSET